MEEKKYSCQHLHLEKTDPEKLDSGTKHEGNSTVGEGRLVKLVMYESSLINCTFTSEFRRKRVYSNKNHFGKVQKYWC